MTKGLVCARGPVVFIGFTLLGACGESLGKLFARGYVACYGLFYVINLSHVEDRNPQE